MKNTLLALLIAIASTTALAQNNSNAVEGNWDSNRLLIEQMAKANLSNQDSTKIEAEATLARHRASCKNLVRKIVEHAVSVETIKQGNFLAPTKDFLSIAADVERQEKEVQNNLQTFTDSCL